MSSGTLTKNSSSVTAGSTSWSSGECLVWTPASGFSGTTAAFTVKAWDGSLASSPAVVVNVTVSASASVPQLTSWYTAQAGKYARIQETDAEAVAGTSKTTWTRTTGMFTLAQTTPVYAGPTQIDYSANWVYVRTPSLGTYTMGPWYNDAAKSQLFINVPKNQGLIIRIPRDRPFRIRDFAAFHGTPENAVELIFRRFVDLAEVHRGGGDRIAAQRRIGDLRRFGVHLS